VRVAPSVLPSPRGTLLALRGRRMRRFASLALGSIALALVPAHAALAVCGDRVLQASEACDARAPKGDVACRGACIAAPAASTRSSRTAKPCSACAVNDVYQNRTCTTDSCDVTDGCQHTPRLDGASCGGGTCHGGLCS
jgi:hypothetical protein